MFPHFTGAYHAVPPCSRDWAAAATSSVVPPLPGIHWSHDADNGLQPPPAPPSQSRTWLPCLFCLSSQGLPGVRVFGFWSHSAPELTALVAALQRTVTDTHSPTERKTAPAQTAAPVPSPATSATGSASTSEASDAIKGMLGIGSAPKPASTDAPQKRAAAPGTRGAAQGAVGTRGRRGTSGSPTAAAAPGAGAAAGSAATSSGAGASDGAGAGSGRRTAEKQAAKKASNGAGAVGRGAGAAATAKPGLASAAGTALATGSAGITPAAGKPVDRAALRDALVALADDDAFMTAVSRAYEKAMAAKVTTATATAVAGAPTAAPSADSAAGAARPQSASTGGRGSGGRGSRRSKGASKRAN